MISKVRGDPRLWLLASSSLILGLFMLEWMIRLTGLDHRLLVRGLFFQAADIPIHRNSADPFLHYELKAGARYHGTFAGKPPYDVTIDEHGARFPTHPLAKAEGTFRILAFGGSTMYGGAVNDNETIAAALERRLNAEVGAAPTSALHFEVWNFGTSAYTLGQAAHLARTKLSTLHPDLILVQHHNHGRRAFLMPEDYRPAAYPSALLASDPHLYQEQFYAPPLVAPATHLKLMRYVALYRSIVASIPSLAATRGCEYGDHLSADEARSLSRETAAVHVPVIYFAIPADRGALARDTIFPELAREAFVDLNRPDRDPAFYEVHPPGATLDAFAALLMEELRTRHVLPTAAPRP